VLGGSEKWLATGVIPLPLVIGWTSTRPHWFRHVGRGFIPRRPAHGVDPAAGHKAPPYTANWFRHVGRGFIPRRPTHGVDPAAGHKAPPYRMKFILALH
jgi:hypothetical protein